MESEPACTVNSELPTVTLKLTCVYDHITPNVPNQSRVISEAKLDQAWLVPGWETIWEY